MRVGGPSLTAKCNSQPPNPKLLALMNPCFRAVSSSPTYNVDAHLGEWMHAGGRVHPAVRWEGWSPTRTTGDKAGATVNALMPPLDTPVHVKSASLDFVVCERQFSEALDAPAQVAAQALEAITGSLSF